MAQKIKAKFRVHNVSDSHDYEGKKWGERVQMSPVYSSDPNSENYSFSKATPSGQIEMFITNPEAFGAFPVNAEVYVDFTVAEVK